MVRYLYNRESRPPAPFIHVHLRGPGGQRELRDQPSQLDTAADRTAIPLRLAEELGLVPLDRIAVVGFGGSEEMVTTYALEVTIRSLSPVRVEVMAHEKELWIPLGRDVLNHFRVLLDGPQLTLEIG
jgi:hypothetical protein